MLSERRLFMYRKHIKRIFDILISALGLILLSWLYLLLAIIIRLKLGSPIIFHQDRPGFNEQIFRLYKFRTMTDARDEQGNLLPDKDRLTKLGKILRATSLDELPELWNIFIGDMSLIGPRPLLVSYLPWYTKRERTRHDVRPGLTGLAQVSGRNNLKWADRFETDAQYVENLSFALDVKIFFMTIGKLFKHSDVAEDTNKEEGNFAKIRQEQIKEGLYSEFDVRGRLDD